MQEYAGMHDALAAGSYGFVACPMRICIQWWLWEECITYGENFGLQKGDRALSFSCVLQFCYALDQEDSLIQSFVLKCDKSDCWILDSCTVAMLENLQTWEGHWWWNWSQIHNRITLRVAALQSRFVWYSQSHHSEDPIDFCIEKLCLLRVPVVPCPDKLSTKHLSMS